MQSLHGRSPILSFAKSIIKQECGTGRYIELHVWSSHQHERAQRLYVCAFVQRRIDPRLVYVSSRVSNVKIRLLQNNLLTAATCWTNSHLNTAAVAINSIAFLG